MQKYDVEVMTGKANLEVRPTFVNKGEIAKKLVAEYPDDAKPDFVLCLGDDTTDEGECEISNIQSGYTKKANDFS